MPSGRLEHAHRHDLRRERVVAARRRVEGSVRGLDGVDLRARLLLRSRGELPRRQVAHGRHVGRDVESSAPAAGELHAAAIYIDAGATLEDLREAVTTLEELERTAQRVLGVSHPLKKSIAGDLRAAQAALRAREDGKKIKFVKH